MTSKSHYTKQTGNECPWREELLALLGRIAGLTLTEQADELDGFIEGVHLYASDSRFSTVPFGAFLAASNLVREGKSQKVRVNRDGSHTIVGGDYADKDYQPASRRLRLAWPLN